MAGSPRPRITHLALFAFDLNKMVDFYTRVMGLTVSDRGQAMSAPVEMVFMSNDPGEHHQFVLASGRPEDATFNVAQQVSFLLDDLDQLREMHDRVEAEGLEVTRVTTHGNAWSVYFNDPDGNNIELYVHTPWHIPQPHVHPFDISQSNEEIMAQTESHCRKDQGFMSASKRKKVMAERMGLAD